MEDATWKEVSQSCASVLPLRMAEHCAPSAVALLQCLGR